MDGGRTPMRDGDWAVLSPARHLPASSVDGRAVLLQVSDETGATAFQIKRLRKEGAGWLLTSDNPDGPTLHATEDMEPIARIERTFSPEALGPSLPAAPIPANSFGSAFGIDDLVTGTGRYGGHLFLIINERGLLKEPDRVAAMVPDRRPSETAFVVAKRDDEAFSYLGVGRWIDDDDCWAIPDVDFATWRRWGTGRETSRRLPEGALTKAQAVADALLALPEANRVLTQSNGRRARVLGRAQKGGLRIDGTAASAGGFKERTVSLIDLAWVIVAAEDVASNGGVLDEPRVNRVRYLDGTPKGSTRWIDTGWAIAAWQTGRPMLRHPLDPGALRKVVDDDGREIDASFRVETVGERRTIVFESRGGTAGTKQSRNEDYNRGLSLVLKQIAEAGEVLLDALVESRDTASVPEEQRRLVLSRPYPIQIEDPEALRREMSRAQAKVGRAPGAKGGGNQTRRLRLFVGRS